MPSSMRLQNHYQQVIGAIRREHDIPEPSSGQYLVTATASLAEVIRHTAWYVGGHADRVLHYRYNRYMEVMSRYKPGACRIAHVEIGCGAGLFSWVFLDWATAKGVEYDRLDLYGYDHSPAMLELARECRKRLLLHAPDYPPLHYESEVAALCTKLKENRQDGTNYVITFGHVLAQAHSPEAIKSFTKILIEVLKLNGICILMAVDADQARAAFAKGWDALMNSLDSVTDLNIQHKNFSIQKTAINDDGRAKVAGLSLSA